MRKSALFNLSLTLVFFVQLCSCEEVDPPEADFSVTQKEIDGDIHVTFTDLSTNEPDHWEWTFGGGTPKTSKKQNPTIVFNEPGKFDVNLKSLNDGGSDVIYKPDYVNIARFTNPMITDAELSLGSITKIIPANSSVHVAMLGIYNTISCHVETSGKNVNGEQIGLLIYWDFVIDVSEYYYFIFDISFDLVFLNVTNKSNVDFTHFMVNCGNPRFESLEEVFIPNNGIKHNIGYYVAKDEMEIRAYCSEGYVILRENTSFYIPWKDNQSVNLLFDQSLKVDNNIIIEPKTCFSEEINNNSQLNNKVTEGTKLITETGFR